MHRDKEHRMKYVNAHTHNMQHAASQSMEKLNGGTERESEHIFELVFLNALQICSGQCNRCNNVVGLQLFLLELR